ncbi:MAG: VIT domain-containing protein [Pyrinomonadaceae bacterium]
MRKGFLLFVIFALSTVCAVAQGFPVTQGTLNAFGEKGDLGACPLKHTDVKAEISGFLSRVRVTQEFENNFAQPIEAVYTFPLSNNAAVDDMTMRIGSRVIKGKILKREEARQVYENARSQGQTAALLDQERPNIFTQSVANILTGEKIIIEISYVETLKYEDGQYEFVFPMTVGPRYIPGSATGRTGAGFSPDTDKVPDASRVTPKIAETRAGHDISIQIKLDAGVPIEGIRSTSHDVQTVNLSPNSADLTLRDEKTIPNKDFVLRYDVTGGRIEDAILAHRDARGGFFTLILQPPDKFTVKDVAPKEIVFVLDTSGSMSGFPIEKAKEAMKLALEGLYPRDTFNLITFAGDTHVLFDEPVPATAANLGRAQEFLQSRRGGGGTEMMKAIRAALDPSDSQEHLRIVCFMTDGYVGNEAEIITEVQKHPNARVFSFGIGSSVNRFLLDKMAEEGRGEVEYVSLGEDGTNAARKFHERVRNPLLTDISIDWNDLPVADVYPSRISDLFSAKPVILNGRYTAGADGTIKLKGKVGGQYFERDIPVRLPEAESRHDSLATLWARKRIDELTSKGYQKDEDEKARQEINDAITNIGLEFRLMTQFTSFVAVEERVVNRDGQPVKIEVPVEMPEGVSREKIFGGWLNGDVSYITNKNFELKGQGSVSGNRSAQSVVTVSAASPSVVNTSNASIGNNFPSAQINSLPANGRNFSSLLTLSPGLSVDGASGAEDVFVVDGTEVKNFHSEKLRPESGDDDDIITSSVANLEKPQIPQKGTWSKKDAVVNVEIAVDLKGEISGAKAVSGSEILRKPAETAANHSKFTPPTFQGESLRMTGVIVYNFIDKENVTISLDKMRVELTPAIKRKLLLRQKLHFWLYDLVERLDKGDTKPTPNEANFIYKGKAEVQVILAENTPEAIDELKKAGLEIERQADVQVVGRIAIEKLADLALLDGVKYVSP